LDLHPSSIKKSTRGRFLCATLEVTLAIEHSSATGKLVTLPLAG